ncbi:Uncharacterized protein Rs2_09286 [Raphanus sativus]|nr:Uncharacterized protein Rs2_09286 [Raphanus sativus]
MDSQAVAVMSSARDLHQFTMVCYKCGHHEKCVYCEEVFVVLLNSVTNFTAEDATAVMVLVLEQAALTLIGYKADGFRAFLLQGTHHHLATSQLVVTVTSILHTQSSDSLYDVSLHRGPNATAEAEKMPII